MAEIEEHDQLDIGQNRSSKCLDLECLEVFYVAVKKIELLHDPVPKKVPPDIDVAQQGSNSILIITDGAYETLIWTISNTTCIGEDINFCSEIPPLPHDKLYTQTANYRLELECSRLMTHEVPSVIGGFQEETQSFALMIVASKVFMVLYDDISVIDARLYGVKETVELSLMNTELNERNGIDHP
ncbi:hypothetical protein LIER_12247 [Lithospermum erythrorhizon]|uniref:Uncharacterized protein n=1 Tax=Lithospermum erythrorhizon TaxID=34254 RepID=A0AAV3PR03_LITER